MRYSLAVAALASLAAAAPYFPAEVQAQEVENIHWVVETVVQTVYVTDNSVAQPTPVAQPQQQQQPQQQPAKTPAKATPAPAAGGNYGSGYIGIVNKYRAVMGLSALKQSSQLEANALKTCQDGHGQMVHELNPGSYGQVLAPGGPNDFEHCFVGGWLCEVPSLLKGSAGLCDASQMGNGWDHQGQTGHADILSSSQYSQIGCALAEGIWGCDLA